LISQKKLHEIDSTGQLFKILPVTSILESQLTLHQVIQPQVNPVPKISQSGPKIGQSSPKLLLFGQCAVNPPTKSVNPAPKSANPAPKLIFREYFIKLNYYVLDNILLISFSLISINDIFITNI
jgi:hypothetical protein